MENGMWAISFCEKNKLEVRPAIIWEISAIMQKRKNMSFIESVFRFVDEDQSGTFWG